MGVYVNGKWREDLADPNPGGGSNLSSESQSPSRGGSETSSAVNTGSSGSSGGSGWQATNSQAIGYNAYGDAIFNTPNGQKTGTQITQELQAAGWNGQGNPVDVYNATAKGGSSPAGTPGTGTPGTPTPQMPGNSLGTGVQTNVDANVGLLNAANQKALIEYYNSKLALDSDQLAFQKATQAFTNEVNAAGLTGQFQGMPTQAALQAAAQLFGVWGAPTNGQSTLAAQKQAYDLAQQQAQLTGYYQSPVTVNGVPQVPGAAAGQGIPTLALQQQQQQAAQAYLQLLSTLRGPADYMKYQQVLGATPNGIRDLVGAAAGQYIPGVGSGTTGRSPEAVSLAGFVNQASGQGALGSPADQASLNALVAPNQVAPQTWSALTPSQQQMLLGTWESQGYTQDDAKSLLQQSLPKYAGTAPQSGTFRLQ